MSIPRPRLLHLALIPLLLLVQGCAAPTPSQPSVTVTVTAPADPLEQVAPGGQANPATETAQWSSAPSSTDAASPSPLPLPPRTVNAMDFRGEDQPGHFFTSPSGNLLCGIFDEGPFVAGCQSQSLVDNLPSCNDPMVTWGPIISLMRSGGTDVGCTHDGVYSSSNAPVLHYGQELTVGDISCTSRETGISCRSGSSGDSFNASRKSFTANS